MLFTCHPYYSYSLCTFWDRQVIIIKENNGCYWLPSLCFNGFLDGSAAVQSHAREGIDMRFESLMLAVVDYFQVLIYVNNLMRLRDIVLECCIIVSMSL